ncbi:MAG: bifunctional oligoribonuclease/PAP phosphatase NrnA [Acidobacteria bacterium]|nr:bifunctional oligoribonuclease/PAP phosphatase NrnA [Acidobacteriota bacterium]
MFKQELALFYTAIQKARRVMITATEREDGDSIAAELAVKYIIEKAFPSESPRVHIINLNPCPERFRFLHGADDIVVFGDHEPEPYDVGIVVDCGIDRSGRVKSVYQQCGYRVKIDHHSFGNAGSYDLEICTRDVASTTEILYHFIDNTTRPLELDPVLAEMIYVGISCDTGSFRYDLTKPSTHRIAARLLQTGFDFTRTAERVHLTRTYTMKKLLGRALNRMETSANGHYLYSCLTREMVTQTGATQEDLGDIIDELCFVQGIEVSMLFVEESEAVIRVSFRSKGRLNVGRFARQITDSGGGHPRASGCIVQAPLAEAVRFVCGELEKEMARLRL